jgi:malto-oligosyltrehalose trehalohydrolase
MTDENPHAPSSGRHGPRVLPGGGVHFALWAPAHDVIALRQEDGLTLPMNNSGDGWHELETDKAKIGSLYRFVLPDGEAVPDPASRFQPQDVHGPSEVIDPSAYGWRDKGWIGRPWVEAVLYELHIGAFTEAGTFRGAINRLDDLKALGITAITIMPVSDFPGDRNWGYDGVLPYAPDSSYGRPDDLKALIDAAHARGMMAFLDVVYNHFGPDGNYLSLYAPDFFNPRHRTPWGAAINYDGPGNGPVREFIIGNALYWIDEFHFDGLRLDAVHAILDDSETHVLDELVARVRAAAAGRHIHLILENEENESRYLAREQGATRRWTAQWNDDVHHVLHVAATSEDKGYYSEYLDDTGLLARALGEGFAFQGQTMRYRDRERGEPSAHLPPDAFVSFIQNHDQIGNRAFGDRLATITPPEALRAIASVYLLAPQVPMIFMGEEWGATQPFLFFCDFSGDLAEAVRNGRREEFKRFPEFQSEAIRARIPDPLAWSTFEASRLRWADRAGEPHAAWLAFYTRALAARREIVIPLLSSIRAAASSEIVGDGAVALRWDCGGKRTLMLEANLTARETSGFGEPPGRVVWLEGATHEHGVFGLWTVRWTVTSDAAQSPEFRP